MGLDIWGWTLAIVAAFAVGLAKGGLSMVGVIAVPLMALVMSPVQAAGILLPVYVASDIGGLVAFRRDFDRRVRQRCCRAPSQASGWAGPPPIWSRNATSP
ncbi:TSUP family transporter [Paracoccus mutanolyticus]|uniref:TSUP family transporter n=1 Tax=Paracoccus mutanolyticus TaxID=1499308 RepID=UPI0037C5428A